MKRPLGVILLALLLAPPLDAQTVTFRGRGEPDIDARIRDWLQERVIWTNDTTIARGDTVRTPVLIVGAVARIEGTIAAPLAGVRADLFIRPSAVMQEEVVNVAGGYYPSDRATVLGSVDDRPNAPYEIERQEDGSIRIIGTDQRRWLELNGIFGFTIPTYDRVDGLSPRWGGVLALPLIERVQPELHGHLAYRSERGVFDGGGELVLARGRTSVAFGAERTTLTNERWIRSDLTNSISYLVRGNDYRDYYEADRIWGELRRVLERGERTSQLWLRGQFEDAFSLVADDPWSIFKPDSIRPNLPVDEGRISSLRAGAETLWERERFVVSLGGEVEVAGTALDGEYDFARYLVAGTWAMPALRDHTLALEWHLQGPLPGTESLPRQRWSFVGGSGTLPTFDVATFRGDRVVFVGTNYDIPLGERLRIPMLGVPSLELLHAAGMAWTAGDARALEQNIGLRLRLGILALRVMTNPDDFQDSAEFSITVSFPRRALPWQASGGFF